VTWSKATNKQTGEVQFVASLAGIDADVYTIELVDGEPIEPLREEARAVEASVPRRLHCSERATGRQGAAAAQ
jgi:hypothetical protein